MNWKIYSRTFFRGKDEPNFWKKDRKMVAIVYNPLGGKPSYQVRLSSGTQDKKGKAISRGKMSFYEAQKFAKDYMRKH